MNEKASAPGALDFVAALVNTLDVATGVDSLDTADGRERFGLRAGELDEARELREALRAACLAHAGHPPHRTTRPLSELLAGAPLLVAVDEAGAARLEPADPAPLAARVAHALAQAAADGSWLRLKACEAEDCLEAYYDRSPAGRRRWCSMQVCGARAKMRTYRAKSGPSGE
ncbi:CGNR zinc finger domain-containing protein [Streptomyces sp. B-S-A8]|uniref:CGNR zinc finger domain-containing protein n=1 Tax=Streptomyces solicavernae TaxID=3043614 RepID=A0ABT6S182_9ACTN|nr:CGNR zinc finger domain-containing protein [Streptomyces sp. B-S-A8]MDI3390454.1 CGNR zinc finger domain-containing protein [Streptomyces sp. B-S-A8]